jgi:hypothetical protein
MHRRRHSHPLKDWETVPKMYRKRHIQEAEIMQVQQTQWTPKEGWKPKQGHVDQAKAQLVLYFGSPGRVRQAQLLAEVKAHYPHAHLLGCSTAGEIVDVAVCDETLVVTAIQFDHTTISGASIQLQDSDDSYQVGKQLARQLDPAGLRHVFVLSDGLKVNGSELVKGLSDALSAQVSITGGLSGDGDRFQETIVGWDAAPASGVIAALGFYGDRLQVGYGSLGGWDAFGPERLITRSSGNKLYELDGKSALQLYKTYLGEHAAGLPATALLFPLSLRHAASAVPVVRTVLAVDEGQASMTFAGDVPAGAYARFMKANFDRLVVGAAGAAMTSFEAIGARSPALAILISCVGRKLVLKQRIEEEVESVRHVLGEHTMLTGFYSYGEISPFTPGTKCELHNQTMTITTFSEQ